MWRKKDFTSNQVQTTKDQSKNELDGAIQDNVIKTPNIY